MPEVSLWSVELENVGQVAPGVKKRYHGAWSQARLWQWTPVVFAGLEVTPTLQCNSDLGGGTRLTSVHPPFPTMIWMHIWPKSVHWYLSCALLLKSWKKKRTLFWPDLELWRCSLEHVWNHHVESIWVRVKPAGEKQSRERERERSHILKLSLELGREWMGEWGWGRPCLYAAEPLRFPVTWAPFFPLFAEGNLSFVFQSFATGKDYTHPFICVTLPFDFHGKNG